MKINFKILAAGAVLPFLALSSGALQIQKPAPTCTQCAVWSVPQAPFKIYGNTYYVGTHGLSSILINSGAGLVLIDGALPQSPPQIEASIKSLGFNIKDELKRKWDRRTRLQCHEAAAQKTPGAYPDYTPQLGGKYAKAA